MTSVDRQPALDPARPCGDLRSAGSDGGRACYYLVGPTGYPNYGDELIAAAWLRHLAQVAPDADVWLDCHSPGSAQVLFDGLHPRVRFVDTLWRLCWHAPSDEPHEVAAWVQHAVHDLTLAPRWTAGIELLARADVLHIIGGGYINAIWPRHLGLLAGAAAAADRSGGRAVMTGQGLFPAPPECTELLRVLADRFDVVEVRDGASAQLLGRLATLGADDAFLGLGPHLLDPAGDAPQHMLCLQSDLVEGGLPELAEFTLATLRGWGVAPDDVGLVEGIPGQDRVLYDLLRPQLPGCRFYPFSALWSAGLPAAAGQTWISTRFHMHLLAAAAGAAGVAVDVKPGYYTAKHRSLIDLGSSWTFTSNLSVPAQRPTGGFPEAVLDRLRSRKRALAREIYSRTAEAAAVPAQVSGFRRGPRPPPDHLRPRN
jgi:Polysaccharide pyruvyl transferase